MKQKMKQKSKIIMSSVLVFAIAMMVLSVVGISRTVTEARETMISFTPEAILASAGVENGADISLAVRYVDQKQDKCDAEARQFEWTKCGYGVFSPEEGLVDFYLGEDYLPVALGGKLSFNRGLSDINRWFTSVDGVSQEYTGKLLLNYRTDDEMSFAYFSDNFYPLDDKAFSDGDSANQDGHNHLFTMNFMVPFTVLASGEESFVITADDDTFVFVGNKLALDMGGVHDRITGRFEITENGEVYTGVDGQEMAYSGITINGGDAEVVRIFHADRDSRSSVFGVEFNNMNLKVVNSEFAGADGAQVAYDPNDPLYVAPLGESEVVRPHMTKQYIVIVTVLGMAVVVFAMMIAMLMRRITS